MKQNVLEKTDYLVPSCKAIDVRVEGVLCGSVQDTYFPDNLTGGLNGWFEEADE